MGKLKVKLIPNVEHKEECLPVLDDSNPCEQEDDFILKMVQITFPKTL